MAPNGKTEEEERHLETHKTVEVESDEDFAVALESPDPETKTTEPSLMIQRGGVECLPPEEEHQSVVVRFGRHVRADHQSVGGI
ncbi:hypothetical protein F7725_008753 [Dissostichus mawsoni]|uniref:Uncharacterized protein n=1 Tax=Dissostichus mawsoni TaxID=36200 RepID=A0A7J5Y886_DISMA|nr:hypothetical protein F7725_008753 [Dissostichus mawsoni]